MMKHPHPHLPQYFAIKCDETHPLWQEYNNWAQTEYTGVRTYRQNFGLSKDVFVHDLDTNRVDPYTLITLSEWKQAIDKTEDMKETEFKPGEYCRFSNNEIPKILDELTGKIPFNFLHSNEENNDCLLIDKNGKLAPFSTCLMTDGYLEYVEITREQFMFKATRGKGISAPDFDPKKSWEAGYVNDDGTEEIVWTSSSFYFIGYDLEGDPVVQNKMNYSFESKDFFIRNIESFHAGMLEVGEHIIITAGTHFIHEGKAAVRSGNTLVVLDSGHCFCKEQLPHIMGKRVKVNITTEEI